MRSHLRFISTIAIAAMLAAVPGSAQRTSGPKVRYAMDVATASGFAAMAAGGKGGMGNMLGMMMGGGPESQVARTLELRIGGNAPATPPPARADHYFLPAAKLGASLPLLGPLPGKPAPEVETMPKDFERPRGRLLLFWGCGAKAGPGQPVIIDFARLAAGQMPPNLYTTTIPRIREVTAATSAAYADWPNSKSSKAIPKDSSLLGAHRISGNVGPEINFTLAQDYMPALNAGTAPQADGSVLIRWNQLAPATSYVAWAFGGMDRGGAADMVWWTSSNAREFGGGLWDWLPPETVRGLVTRGVVMPPAQTSCAIPAEAKAASGEMMFGNLNAFGPEANFSYPPKPAAAKATWAIDWTAKVRFRSHTSLMIGVDMGDMGSGSASAAEKPRKKKCKGPLGIPIPGVSC